MVKKYKIRLKYLLLLIFIMFSNLSNGQPLYKINRENDKTELIFNEKWFFSKILIPVCSEKIWGDDKAHNIAVITIDTEKHILSSKFGERFLQYIEPTKAINKIVLKSINSTSERIEKMLPYFKATSEKTKQIEDNLLIISVNERRKIEKNKCFSCHSLIPAALTFKTAKYNGFNLEKSEVLELINDFSALQNKEGSFYFESEPIYGKNTTTLAALCISALFSDISQESFFTIANKARNYLNSIQTKNEPVKSDFIFEPFFNSETTSLLFEIIFLKNLYLKMKIKSDKLNERINELLNIVLNTKEIMFDKKLLLLCGIPYSYQINPLEKKGLIKELQEKLQESSSKNVITKLLCFYVYNKISSNKHFSKIIDSYYNSFDNKNYFIWNCLEEIICYNPKYLDGIYDEK